VDIFAGLIGEKQAFRMKKHQTTGVLLLAMLVLAALFVAAIVFQRGPVTIEDKDYSQFVRLVDRGEISKVVISGNMLEAVPKSPAEIAQNPPSQQTVTVPAVPPSSATSSPQTTTTTTTTTRTPQRAPESNVSANPAPSTEKPAVASPMIAKKYRVVLPEMGGAELLVPHLEKAGVDFRFEPPQSGGRWWTILWTLFLPVMLLVVFLMVYRNAQAGGSQAMSFGKSRAKMSLDSKVKITFKDVAGIDEAKQELEEIVDFLKSAERYHKLGARIPKGVLLVGSPGTGKTMLAKAVAGEAGVPFFSISGSDFVEMFVGVGASRVRDLFEQAKKHAPCIVFVDEIDAVGRQRGAGLGGGHDEREQTLNQLLVEMDGFDPTTGIIVIAATNRPDILDNALLRPGRFDRQVVIDKPDLNGREQILKVHAKGKPLSKEVDMKRLAKRTSGFTGADLSNLLNEAALLAARRKKEEIDPSDVEDSIDRVVVGLEKKSKLISEKDKEITAYHEIGHALTCVLTPGMDPLRKVTIVPRGMALGYAWYAPEDDMERTHISKTRLLGEISVALGGRVAEEIVYGDISTGASNDLEKVSAIARNIVTRYGMTEELGALTYGQRNEHVFLGRDFGTERNYSEEIAAIIDRKVKEIVDAQYEHVRTLLTDNRDMMDALVKVLLEKETLDDKDVNDIIEQVQAERRERAAQGDGHASGATVEVPVGS
jgi:cell division protease FtsH